MAVEDRIESLRTRHAKLDEQVQSEQARRYPDSGLLSRLKLQKLRVKEQLDTLARPH